MHDSDELSPLELLPIGEQEAENAVQIESLTDQQIAADHAAHQLAIASSYPRGLAILAWCRAHPEAVTPKAQLRVDRLHQAMIRGELIADHLVEVLCWVLDCPRDLRPIRPNLIPMNSAIDAEGVGTTASRQINSWLAAAPDADALDAEILVATATPASSEN